MTTTNSTTTIDLTPTWKQNMRMLITVLCDGDARGKKYAQEELMKVADFLDEHNKQADKKSYSFEEIKASIVTLAANNQLPIDMNELSEDLLFPPVQETDNSLAGYRVAILNADGQELEPHPDMDNSFSLYSRTQAEAMLQRFNPENKFVLLPFNEGDIEDAEKMFDGNPND